MAFLEGSESLFINDVVDDVRSMDMPELYIGTLEAIHACDLLMVHGYNIDTYIDNVYSKEDTDTSPDKQESLGKRIWEGIKKFIATVVEKLVQLYEWFMKLIANFSKEIDNLTDQVSKLDDISISRETMNKLDNVKRPSFGALSFIRDTLHSLTKQDLTDIVNIKFEYNGASVSLNYEPEKLLEAINEYSEDLREALVQDSTAYGTEGSDVTTETIRDMLESSRQVLDDTATFKSANANTVSNLKRVLSMHSRTSIFATDAAKQNNRDVTSMCRAIVGLFNVYTKASSKFLFTVIMIAKTFIKASSAQPATT